MPNYWNYPSTISIKRFQASSNTPVAILEYISNIHNNIINTVDTSILAITLQQNMQSYLTNQEYSLPLELSSFQARLLNVNWSTQNSPLLRSQQNLNNINKLFVLIYLPLHLLCTRRFTCHYMSLERV